MLQKRTDLAIEIQEGIQEKNELEIEGVVVKEWYGKEKYIRMTEVQILDEKGAKRMGKPAGKYVTIELLNQSYEFEKVEQEGKKEEIADLLAEEIAEVLNEMVGSQKHYFVMGLGNRFATPDALGPFAMKNIYVNRHFVNEYGEKILGEKEKIVSALMPGVMSQTGMESKEILSGVIQQINPEVIIVIDALASKSVNRLCTTIQITDTGISPGAGIGNNRKVINEESMGIRVIAIGVPTVVGAETIVQEYLESALSKQGLTEEEVETFLRNTNEELMEGLFVTPKDIDEKIQWMAKIVAKGINNFTRNE